VLPCPSQGVYVSPRGLLQSAGPGGDGGSDAALAAAMALGRGSIGTAVGASPPDIAALLVFEELAHMTRVGGAGGRGLTEAC
jgi:hypothetical protein